MSSGGPGPDDPGARRGGAPSLRAAVERTLAASAGSALHARERAGELLDEVARRGRSAGEEVARRGQSAGSDLARRGQSAGNDLARRGQATRGDLARRLSELEERLASLERRLARHEGSRPPEEHDEDPD